MLKLRLKDPSCELLPPIWNYYMFKILFVLYHPVFSMFANDNEKPPSNNVLLITCKYWFIMCKSSQF